MQKHNLSGLQAVLVINTEVLRSHLMKLLHQMGIDTVNAAQVGNQEVFQEASYIFYEPGFINLDSFAGLSGKTAKLVAVGTFNTPGQDTLRLAYPFGFNQLYSTLTDHTHKKCLFPSCSILLVDDNEINLTVAEETLKGSGFTTDRAYSGQQALDKLEKETYDIIMMDLHMPVMDGIETSRRIRNLQLGFRPVIIALTADINEDMKIKALNSWFDDYVTKPYQPDKLISLLQKWSRLKTTEDLSCEPAAHSPKLLPSSLPGLDISSGLARLNGSNSAYLNILDLFLKNEKGLIKNLKQALEQNDTAAAKILCHTLKGVSANLGAQDLSTAAAAFEQKLKTAESDGLTRIDMSSLEQNFYLTYSTAEALVNKFRPLFEADLTAKPLSSGNVPGEQLNKIEALILLSERYDIKAYEKFVEAKNYLVGKYGEEQVQALQEALDQMNWEAVLEILNALKNNGCKA